MFPFGFGNFLEAKTNRSEERLLNLMNAINDEDFEEDCSNMQENTVTINGDDIKRYPQLNIEEDSSRIQSRTCQQSIRILDPVGGVGGEIFNQIVTASSLKHIEVKNNKNVKMKIPLKFKDYSILKILGSGSFGVVVLIEFQSTHEQYAAKFTVTKQLSEHELSIHLEITSHPNIVKIIDYFILKNGFGDEYYVIVTEYCSFGNICKYVSKLGIKAKNNAYMALYSTLQGVKHMHDKGFCHGDIKPPNILVGDSNYIAKLCDFGFSKHISSPTEGVRQGTLKYAAPEIIYSIEPYDVLAADIYAIGITFKTILYGDLIPISSTPPEFQLFYMMCTQKDPSKRAKIDDLIESSFLKKFQ